MRKNKLIVDVLITTGLMLIILIVIIFLATSIPCKELFEIPVYSLYFTVGNIKLLVSQIMLGLGIIGGAQIIFLIIKRTKQNM